jgi:multidrug efflux pump subunit AcrB
MTDAKQYQPLILTQRGNTPVKLDAFGRAVEGVENNRLAGWSGTNRAVLVIIQKQAGANVIQTVDRIRAVLPQLERWMPPAAKITMLSDRTKTIRASVNDVQFSLLLSIALVVMVIFLFLRRFWPTFIASVTVPLALSGTVAIMYLLHYSLDNLSLMAITISVGFVVDDAIVVIENVHRFIEKGDAPMQAAFKGARQIGFTVVSMSLSLIGVFIPLLFMSGLIGRLFHEFAVTVSLAILVSGVISLTLTPMLCSRFLRAESESTTPGAFSRACERGYQWMLDGYEAGLKWCCRVITGSRSWSLLTMAATVCSTIAASSFPQQDSGTLPGTPKHRRTFLFTAMAELQQKRSRPSSR